MIRMMSSREVRQTRWLGVVLALVVAVMATVSEANVPDGLEYARISLYKKHRHNNSQTLETVISGVFALYGPVKSVSGRLVISSPIDGCDSVTVPDTDGENFVLLSRLGTESTCTAMDQGHLAKQAGAVGVLNMAPQRNSYIYLLESTGIERSEEARPADIAQVAISGSSGYRFLQAVIGHHGHGNLYVTIQGSTEEVEEVQILDLVVAVSCMVVAVLVLLYAYRVGRNLCLAPPPVFVDPDEIPEEKLRDNREKMSSLLKSHIKVVKYECESPDCDDTCAICIDNVDKGEEIRQLWCKHVFHRECIDPWLLEKQTCPLCKDNVLARAEAQLGEIDCSASSDSQSTASSSVASSRVNPSGARLDRRLSSSLRASALHPTSGRQPTARQHSYEGGVYETDPSIYLPRPRPHAGVLQRSIGSNSSMGEVIEMMEISGRTEHATRRPLESHEVIRRSAGIHSNAPVQAAIMEDTSVCSWDAGGSPAAAKHHSSVSSLSTASIV